ncbi:MAG TPA: peptidase family C69 [Verrucomicrobiae bacterium]|nr:peptidase family C69 [Verrucomicrobiae bacterium]
MSDTQVVRAGGATWFARNSDREPSEPQPVVRLPAVRGDAATTVRVTWLEVPQVPDRHAVLLSKPVWCWGAEMGVNEHGVAVGHQAIFSRQASLAPALLGMDLVRLGLERGGSAVEAVAVIIELLKEHGQGGPAAFGDKRYCHDSSFLVADASEAFVLETAGREWKVAPIASGYAISNALTLEGFTEHDTRVKPFLARATQRRALSMQHLAQPPSLASLAASLRAHAHADEDPAHGSNRDVCMHAAGLIRRHQTTGSMIARLTAAGPTVLFTGTSAPCLSIFRPAAFTGDFSVLTPHGHEVESLLWRRHEFLHRRALADPALRMRLRATRDPIEARIFESLTADAPAPTALAHADRLAAAWHKVLWESLAQQPARHASRYWARLSRVDGIA